MDEINLWKDRFENYLEKNPSSDGSHNIGHFKRVWKTAQNIMNDDCDELVTLAASYFHDIVNYPKDHLNRARASQDAARKAEKILIELDFPSDKLGNVKHCIEAHSFTANISTETKEAKIVQDADRMEALGAIGLARTFYVAGRLGTELFDEKDPLAKNRELDDKKYALDHFKVKLLKIPETMQTDEGRVEAIKRARVLVEFIENLKQELDIS